MLDHEGVPMRSMRKVVRVPLAELDQRNVGLSVENFLKNVIGWDYFAPWNYVLSGRWVEISYREVVA